MMRNSDTCGGQQQYQVSNQQRDDSHTEDCQTKSEKTALSISPPFLPSLVSLIHHHHSFTSLGVLSWSVVRRSHPPTHPQQRNVVASDSGWLASSSCLAITGAASVQTCCPIHKCVCCCCCCCCSSTFFVVRIATTDSHHLLDSFAEERQDSFCASGCPE